MSDSRIDWWPPMEGAPPAADPGPATPEPPEPPRRSRARERQSRARAKSQSRRNAVVAIVTAAALLLGAIYVGFSLFGGDDKGGGTAAVSDYPGPGFPSATVVINPGDTGSAMAKTLVEADVVATEKAFTDAFAANPDASKIQPGTYNLLRQMKASDAVLALLAPASRVSMKVTIPEGYTKAQIVTRINEVTLIPTADLEAALADPAAIGLPAEAGGNPEGWLFPSTYQVEPDATAAGILSQMVTATVQLLQTKQVPQDQWMAVLTKASLVEEEAGRDEDRGPMARAIQNRLDQSWPLKIDATVAYGLGKPGTDLTQADLDDANNPYNSYQHGGLPPTPIASPGEKSIDAVLSPDEGTWMFWCTVNPETKETRFSTTLDEHNQCVADMNAWISEHATSTTNP